VTFLIKHFVIITLYKAIVSDTIFERKCSFHHSSQGQKALHDVFIDLSLFTKILRFYFTIGAAKLSLETGLGANLPLFQEKLFRHFHLTQK
jgi:hypothetical protein